MHALLMTTRAPSGHFGPFLGNFWALEFPKITYIECNHYCASAILIDEMYNMVDNVHKKS